MRVALIQSYYTIEPHGIDVHLCGRAEDGNRIEIVVTGHKPRFWIKEDPNNRKASIPDWNAKVTNVTQRCADMYGHPLWEIETKIPAYVGDATKGIKKYFKYHYEADILFVNRTRVDLGIRYEFEVPTEKLIKESWGYSGIFDEGEIHGIDDQSIEPTWMAMDIEVSDEKGYAGPDKPYAPVLCVTLYNNKDDTFYILIDGWVDKAKALAILATKLQGHLPSNVMILSSSQESELFDNLVKLINKEKPDIIMGWNFCRVGLKEGYDIPYLRKRAKARQYNWIDEKPIMWFDLMAAASLQIGPATYMKLDEYAKKIGLAKEKLDMGIHDSYMQEREKLILYNMWDTALCVIAIKREGLLEFYLNLTKLCGCFLDDTYMKTRLVDMFILHSLYKKGVVLPSLEFMKKPEDFEGAFVSPASKGLYKDVVALDIKAEYPSIIRTFNLSPETRIRQGEFEPNVPRYKLPSGNEYIKEPKGIITVMLEQIMHLREDFVNRMNALPNKKSQEFKNLNMQQYAMKFFINSVYGVIGSSHYRLADSEMAQDITLMGQLLTKWTWAKLKELGHIPLYSDTDSVMIQITSPTMERTKELAAQLTDTFPQWSAQYNGNKVEAILEVDKIFSAWVQSGKKKRYFGWVVEDKAGRKDYLHVTGFEIKRTNIASLTIKIQEQAFKLILAGSYIELRELLKTTREDILAGKYREELMFPAKYKKIETNAAHYRAACLARELGIELMEEDLYIWTYITPTASLHSDVYAILPDSKLPSEIIIDYEKMISKVLTKPLKYVLESIDMTWDEIITGKKPIVIKGLTLEDFA